MATLVLTTVGTLLGGPIGGAIGAFAGRQIDSKLFGPGAVQGPRVKDLTATTSSYGQPISRHFGQMRVPGTIIWSTELQETKEKRGGGKGKPKTTTYSYTASFAVALASRPVLSIGRIWADGKLLRGAAGDLKTSGTLRFYSGYDDQPVDPLLSAAENGAVPAFRGCAYAVFEDLQLGDYGNRIPALTFEVFADAASEVRLDRVFPIAQSGPISTLEYMKGFTDEGGPLLASLEAIKRLYPLACATAADGISLQQYGSSQPVTDILPQSLLDAQGDSQSLGEKHTRNAASQPSPHAIRYYDIERDYQPGVQRAIGRPAAGREITLDLPAALHSSGARSLANSQASAAHWLAEGLTWRMAELNPAFTPGKLVRAPGKPGIWIIASTEWNESGIELELERVSPASQIDVSTEAGSINPPTDLPSVPTQLLAFELPWDGIGSSSTAGYFAAVSALAEGWSGASLYIDQAGALVPADIYATERCPIGQLNAPLPPSSALFYEAQASVEIELSGTGFVLPSTSVAGIAAGANRMLIGTEIIQYAQATQISETAWRLQGLLRGRAGTEAAALVGHAAGTHITILDDRLYQLDDALIASNGVAQIAAIGLGDDEPAYTSLDITGVSRRPPSPVHGAIHVLSNGDWQCHWVRRGRGQWRWDDYVETPLVEESEIYLVGLGDTNAPAVSWQVAQPSLTITATTRSSLAAQHTNAAIWVKQIGTFGPSQATLLGYISS